jgi:hypothetical protein
MEGERGSKRDGGGGEEGGREKGRKVKGKLVCDPLFEEFVVERQENDKETETELYTGFCPLQCHTYRGREKGMERLKVEREGGREEANHQPCPGSLALIMTV